MRGLYFMVGIDGNNNETMSGGVPTCFPERVFILGVPVDPWTMEQTVMKAEEVVKRKEFAHFIGVNADKVLQIRNDSEMNEIVRRCEVINADGASMVLASKRLGVAVPERVAGIDLMLELCGLCERSSLLVYLVGSKKTVVEQTRANLVAAHPHLNIVGARDGYFSDDDFDDVAKEIKSSNADVVFVGITSPKKEYFIERCRDLGLRGVYVGVGGSFDVISGNIKRAPLWMQKTGLEWLFRMIKEPKRLIRRYVIGNAQFLFLLHKEVRQSKHKNNSVCDRA